MSLNTLYKQILFFLVFVANPAFTQSFLPVCKNFGPEDYTENAEFRCAVSDQKGTLYFGTNYGVLIYTGEKKSHEKNWEILNLPEPDVVLSLYFDSAANRLYTGTRHDFGYFQLKSYNGGEYFSLSKPLQNAKLSLETWHIFKQNSTIIFHTTAALYRYDGAATTILQSNNTPLLHNAFQLNDLLLVNALDAGWWTLNSSLEKVTGKTLPVDKCYAVTPTSRDKEYLFYFRNEGVYKVVMDGNSFAQTEKVSDPSFDKILSEYQVYGAVYNKQANKIILATLNKGTLLLEHSEKLTCSLVLSETVSATRINCAYGLFEDRLKNIWILGKNNLSCLPSDLSLQLASLEGITIEGITSNKDALYVAALNGFYKITVTTTKLAAGDYHGAVSTHDTIFAYTDREVVSVAGQKINHLIVPSQINHVSVCKGQLIISTTQGLYTRLNSLKKDPYLADHNVLQVIEAGQQLYALLAEEGIAHLTETMEISELYELNQTFSSTQNAKLFSDGNRFFISNLKGTYKLENKQIVPLADTRERYWLYKQLPNQATVSFCYGADDDTQIRLRQPEKNFITANSFMSLTEVNDAATWHGWYALATKTGLYFSPLLLNKPAENVRVVKISDDSTTYFDPVSIRIPYENSKNIEIFCALNSFYSAFNNTRYLYKLSNYDNEWNAQYSSNIAFSHLNWGDYILEVKSRYGNDQETTLAKIEIHILKPWWASAWGIILWIALFIIFIYLVVQISVFRLKKSKRKLEEIVHERTQEIVHQKDEIEKQKVEIEAKNHEITDSINYAQRIQNSLLKGEEKLTQTLSDSFVLYLPKDIVSGDFYWFANVFDYHLAAVADCTGHGVPGAFMSMLGVAKLNELAAKNIFMPDQMLHELNRLIVETLGQHLTNTDSRDGMDIAILCIDNKNKKLFYAGANRPLFVVDKTKKELTEIKATKLPVGGGQYGENREYIMHTVDITEGLSVFLCSDGFADQFGGPKGKKFMSYRLQDLLRDIADLPSQKQQQRLRETYLQWKGSLEQIDDVCILGINF